MEVRAGRQNMGQIHITTVATGTQACVRVRWECGYWEAFAPQALSLSYPGGEETMASCPAWLKKDLWEVSSPCFDSVAQPRYQQSPVCWNSGIH